MASLQELAHSIRSNIDLEGKITLSNRLFNAFQNELYYLELNELLVNKAQCNLDESQIVVRGEINFLNLSNLPLTIEIVGEGKQQIRMRIKLPDSWSFGDSFSNLPPSQRNTSNDLNLISLQSSILCDIKFVNTFLIAQDFEDNYLQKGLNFLGETEASFLQPLSYTLGSPNYLTFRGIVILNQGKTPIIDISSINNLSSLRVQGIEIKDINFQIKTDISEKYFSPQTNLVATGKIEIGTSNNVFINVSSYIYTIYGGVNYLSFYTNLLDQKVFIARGIHTLTELVGGSESDFQLVDEINILSEFYLKQISFDLSQSDSLVRNLKVNIDYDKEWIVINGLIKVVNIEITWLIFAPYVDELREVCSGISGILVFGQENQIRFDISASYYTNFVISGALHEGDVLDLSRLIQIFLGDTVNDLPKIAITRLGIEVDLAGNYLFKGTLESDWEINLKRKPFSLKQISLDFSKRGSDTQGRLDGVIYIAGAKLYISAIVPNSDEGFEFEGGTFDNNQEINLTAVGDELLELFDVSLPSSIPDVILRKLYVKFNTKSKDFTFSCQGDFEVEQQKVDITIIIDLTHQGNNSFRASFGGHIIINSLQFDLIFDTTPKSKTFIAAYHDPAIERQNLKELKIQELVEAISPSLVVPGLDSLEFSLKDALFAYYQSQKLFAIDIDSGINLSKLPLVGSEFSPDQTLKLAYQVLIASHKFVPQEITQLNTLISGNIVPLPDENDIQAGLDLLTTLQLSGKPIILDLPVSTPQRTDSDSSNPNQPVAPVQIDTSKPSSSDNTKWFPLQKSFGPVHFERIGVQFQSPNITFLLDASLTTAGLTLTLDGLSVTSPLTTFDPHFNLHGIGIDYQGSSTVTIGGAFLKQDDRYSGTAFIQTTDLTLSAIGSYYTHTPPDGKDPSLFIYALLNKPIGGPPFFFVTGLAAAFGYNRALTLPAIEQVATFPLVQVAKDSTGDPTDLSGMLQKLDSYIPPTPGAVFLAVGVKFTSFNLIDSFALLIATFGDPFELHILGLSTLITPTPEAGVTPLAEVQMALKATFIPEQGFLAITAQLTPSSYLFSRACHLVGGFAYYSWFSGDHAGDFVITLGGYHPHFTVPAHYPQVPRLGFNWQVDDHLTIKGDAYYALTPAALMAGGHLQARWESGPLCAWFNAGADFLIAWKPYHYEASIYVDMGVSYTFEVDLWFTTIRKTISVDIGADLQIWGPDFSGIAHIHLWIVSFDVSFGSGSSQKPQPIDWNTFKASFLPSDNQICSIAVKDGLVRKIIEDKESKDKLDLGVINPKDFALITNAVIPSNQAYLGEAGVENAIDIRTANSEFGIGSMAILSGSLTSTHRISITRNNIHVEQDFDYIPVLKNVPKALWGTSLMPDLNDKQQFIERALCGFEIKPKQPVKPTETEPISQSSFEYSTERLDNAYDWNSINPFSEHIFSSEPKESDRQKRQAITQSITSDAVATARAQLLQALDLQPDLDLSEALANDFLLAPQIELQPS